VKKGCRILCALALALLAGYAFRAPLLRLAGRQSAKVGWLRRRVQTSEVRFPSGRLQIAGTLYSPSTPFGTSPALVIGHGGTPKGRRLALYTVAARKLAERGYVVLAIDFRGFGDSEKPTRFQTASDLDFVQDVTAAVDFLSTLRRVDTSRIGVLGHSFGAGVAVLAAIRDRRISRAVSLSPGRNTARRFFGPGAIAPKYPSRRMSHDMEISPPIPREVFDPHLKDYVAEAILDYPAHPPVLLVDGAREEEEDLAFLKDVAARATEPKGYVTIPGADHYFGTGQRQLGTLPAVPYDAPVMNSLVDAVDGWMRKDFPAGRR
jgi:dienelactone hydrolase